MGKFNCKNCGAEITFDPLSQKMKCKYCDSEYDISEYDDIIDNSSNSNETLLNGNEKSTDDTSDNLVLYHCEHCGADIITSSETTATTCAYCGRPITFQKKLIGEFKPDYIIPFFKTQNDIIDSYKKLCKHSWLVPKEFKLCNITDKIKGVYVPYWLHTLDLHEDINAKCTNIKTWVSRDIQYTKTDTYSVNVSGNCNFDNIPTDGVKDLDNKTMDSIEPFNFDNLMQFKQAYLAGFYAQNYDDNADETCSRAKLRAQNSLEKMLLNQVGDFSTKTIISSTPIYNSVISKYALFPVWLMNTTYHDKTYLFTMNGQTGKMVGKVPLNKLKLFLITLGVFVSTEIIITIIKFLCNIL